MLSVWPNLIKKKKNWERKPAVIISNENISGFLNFSVQIERDRKANKSAKIAKELHWKNVFIHYCNNPRCCKYVGQIIQKPSRYDFEIKIKNTRHLKTTIPIVIICLRIIPEEFQ